MNGILGEITRDSRVIKGLSNNDVIIMHSSRFATTYIIRSEEPINQEPSVTASLSLMSNACRTNALVYSVVHQANSVLLMASVSSEGYNRQLIVCMIVGKDDMAFNHFYKLDFMDLVDRLPTFCGR